MDKNKHHAIMTTNSSCTITLVVSGMRYQLQARCVSAELDRPKQGMLFEVEKKKRARSGTRELATWDVIGFCRALFVQMQNGDSLHIERVARAAHVGVGTIVRVARTAHSAPNENDPDNTGVLIGHDTQKRLRLYASMQRGL